MEELLSVEDELFLFETFLKLSSQSYNAEAEGFFSEDENDVPLSDYFIYDKGESLFQVLYQAGRGSVRILCVVHYCHKQPTRRASFVYQSSLVIVSLSWLKPSLFYIIVAHGHFTKRVFLWKGGGETWESRIVECGGIRIRRVRG